MNKTFQRKGTRFSKDGLAVFVRLQVGRADYEFARQWARFHRIANPEGTAEDQLEGYLSMALLTHQQEMGWQPPDEIKALYEKVESKRKPLFDMDDGIPF